MTMRHRWARGAVLAATVMAAGLAMWEGGDAWAQFGRFGQNKVHYLDFDWRVYHAPHFDVYYYPEEEAFLEQVVSSAESAYLYLSKALDHEPKFRIPLIYYKNHGEFEQTNIDLGFIDLGVLAFAEPLEKRMVLPIDQPPDFLYKVITHELTHIFQFSILFSDSAGRALRGNPAGWLMEGMASHMAQDEDSLAIMFIRDAVVSGLVPPITRVRGGSQLILYRYGQAAFEFIEKEFGGKRQPLAQYSTTPTLLVGADTVNVLLHDDQVAETFEQVGCVAARVVAGLGHAIDRIALLVEAGVALGAATRRHHRLERDQTRSRRFGRPA